MGIATLGALAATPPETLQRTFGARQGAWLVRRAGFEDEGEVAPVRATKSQSSETTFDTDVADRSEQVAVVRRLAGEVAERLERRALEGRTVRIKVRLDDWTTVTRARTLPEVTAQAGIIARVAVELLAAYDPPRPVRLLGVGVAGFPGEAEAVVDDLSGSDVPQLRLAL
jgi:DNA polymerase-4